MTALALAALLAQGDPGMDAVRALLKLRGPEGSWGRTPGDRGRALVALLTGGWSELSKDEVDGLPMGDLIGRELGRIEAGQRDDGLFFPEDPAANAWTALALTESYALTALKRRREPARRAAEAILGMPASEEAPLFWQYMVRVSAASADLMDKGPEPPPLGDPKRQVMVVWWWRRQNAPLPEVDARGASSLDLYLRDLAMWGRPHRRSSHDAWRKRAAEGLPAETDVEGAVFRALVAIPGRCWPCRNVFNND